MAQATEVKIQAVNGLIKRSPVSNKSIKLPTSAKQVRTTGIYARKAWDGQIVIGYSTWGYAHNIERRGPELEKFFEFAKAEGYAFTDFGNNEYVIERQN